jgi:hypothetical protein
MSDMQSAASSGSSTLTESPSMSTAELAALAPTTPLLVGHSTCTYHALTYEYV